MTFTTSAVRMPDLAEGIRCTERGHRSHSGDRRFDLCPWLDHAVRDRGVVEQMGPEACVGSAVDAALVELIAGRTPNLAVLLGTAIGELGDPRKADLWDREEMLLKTIRLVELGAGVLPTYAAWGGIYATQLEIHFDIDGTPFHLHIDAICNDGTVVDWKTSEKRLPDRFADTTPQLSPYFLGVQREYGHTPPRVVIDGFIYANPPEDVRTSHPDAKKPWHDRQIGTRTPAQIAAWLDDFRRREAARAWMGKTGIYPTPGRSALPFVCSGCAARPICPSWQPFL